MIAFYFYFWTLKYSEKKVLIISHFSIERNDGYNPNDYPLGSTAIISQFMDNPKWTSNLFFSFLFLILSSGIVYLLFLKKQHMKLTAVLYVVVFLFAGLLFALGVLFDQPELTYNAPRFIKKHLLHSPFILIIVSFIALEMRRKEKKGL